MKQQAGFTLIELIMVIVILGLLSAVALPQFVDLTGEAETASTEGIAGALSSAATINYAVKKAGNAAAVTVDNCDDGAALLQGGLDADYGITTAAFAAADPEGTVNTACVVTHTASGTIANFTAIKVN